MAETNIIEIKVTDSSTHAMPSAGKTDITGGGKSKGSGIGGMMKLGGTIGIIASVATGIFGLIKGIFSVFAPVINLLKTIMKLIGEFLRPIADMLMMLITPLLSFLRPVLMIFKAMMVPVMQLMREYSMVMSKQMAAGDVTGASATGMNMLTLGLSSFFVAFSSVIAQMLVTALFSAADFLLGKMIDIITYIAGPIVKLIDKFVRADLYDTFVANMEGAKTDISSALSSASSFVNTAIQTGATNLITGIVKTYTLKLDGIKEDLGIAAGEVANEVVPPYTTLMENSGASITGLGETAKTAADTTSTDVSADITTMQTNVTTGIDNVSTKMNSFFGTTNPFGFPKMISTSLLVVGNALNKFTQDCVNAASKIKSALNKAKDIERATTIKIGLIQIG